MAVNGRESVSRGRTVRRRLRDSSLRLSVYLDLGTVRSGMENFIDDAHRRTPGVPPQPQS